MRLPAQSGVQRDVAGAHAVHPRHGIVKVIAKGAHRRTKAGASNFDGGVDLLDLGNGVFTDDPHRDLATLTEWKLQDGFLDLRKNLRGLYLGLYAAELASLLFEVHDAHADVFDRLARTLGELATPRLEEALLSFKIDVLRESGYLPELFACVCCGGVVHEREPAFVSAVRGGLVCRNCEAVVPDRALIDPRLLRLAQGILRLPRVNGVPQRLPHLTRRQTDPLNRLLAEHVTHTLGKRVRMWGYVVGERDGESGRMREPLVSGGK